jgi:hypothetical protein
MVVWIKKQFKVTGENVASVKAAGSTTTPETVVVQPAASDTVQV